MQRTIARHGAKNGPLTRRSTSPKGSPSKKDYDNGKGKANNALSYLMTLVALMVVFALVISLDASNNANSSSIVDHVLKHHPSEEHPLDNNRHHSGDSKAKAKTSSSSNHHRKMGAPIIGNPYEGWQPKIDFEQDKGDAKCNSWRTCFSKDNQRCPAKCRDSKSDFGTAPLRPGYSPSRPEMSKDEQQQEAQTTVEWVPDVTVLRRMYKSGVDQDGNPWPPPLVTEDDRELCEDIGTFGGRTDEHIKLFNEVPIRGMPFVGDSYDAMFQTKKMKRQPKIMCIVYTMEKVHHTNIRVIRETWGPGCDGFLAFSTADDPRIPAISIPHDGEEAYENMWQKVRSIWKFVGKHYLEDFDFFFQGGEDLYVLPQNLRSVLADLVEDPAKDDFFGGRRFQWGTQEIYFNSGGAGYTLSQATLRKLRDTGLDHPRCFKDKHSSMEDVFVARCLKNAFGIDVVDTRDDQERERFHPFGPAGHYNWRPPQNGGRDWYEVYNRKWPPKLGAQCCAPDSVSFHYLKKPAMVRHIHALLYLCDG